MLNLAAGGSDLISDSRVIWSMSSSSDGNYPPGCRWDQDPLVSADGKTLRVRLRHRRASPVSQKTIPWRLSWLEYSTSNPKAVPLVLYSETINASSSSDFWLSGLWINASGSAVIGYRSNGRFAVGQAGVLRRDQQGRTAVAADSAGRPGRRPDCDRVVGGGASNLPPGRSPSSAGCSAHLLAATGPGGSTNWPASAMPPDLSGIGASLPDQGQPVTNLGPRTSTIPAPGSSRNGRNPRKDADITPSV